MTQIIRATPEDADSLTQITIAAKRHWQYPETWIQLWMPKLTVTPEYIQTHETWQVIVDDKSVAYYSFEKSKDGLWLDNLWVLPEFMGLGVGKLLFTHALERCKEQQISILKIEADPNAQSFYEHMGARKVTEHQTEIDGEVRILPIMEIEL
ncbi:MAG: GNAT family N-acetyltransferase [Anaerolineales bacterium]